MSPRHWMIGLGLMLGSVSVAAAQTTAPPPTATDKVVPEKDQSRPADNAAGTSGPTLSEKLTQTNGVIPAPANVDPGMTKAAPNTGAANTPVIPPPGSPGGVPNVQPK